MRILTLLFFLMSSLLVFGQASIKAGKLLLKDEILVEVRSGINERDLKAGIQNIGTYIEIIEIKRLSKTSDVFKILLSRKDNNGEMLEQIQKSPMVISAHYNGVAHLRRVPNDREYNKQWALRNIDMPKAWDITTGNNGKRAPIVVAILDSGIDRNHNDLKDHIWFNKDEIPGDGIDNDGNGYKDDYFGLNIQTKRDDNFEHHHGTQVAGIIGAETNNTDGIAGINWDVQLMTVALAKNGGFELSEIIEGMEYVLDQRRRFNNSEGVQGAFVTVLNFSLGDLGWFEHEFPTICNLFNKLGKEGVLTVAATDNSDSNIDVLGDLPCDCKSKYLITVTNSDKKSEKTKSAGFGVIGIDLAAPGEGIFSTTTQRTYRSGSGCSFAAPMVSGVISLLYSLDCDTLQDLILKEPSKAALFMKEAILNGVDVNAQLDTLVLSDGRLNANGSIRYVYEKICDTNPSNNLIFERISPNETGNEFTVTFKSSLNSSNTTLEIVDVLGKIIKIYETEQTLNPLKMVKVDVSHLVCGTYYLHLYNQDEQVTKQIFVCN